MRPFPKITQLFTKKHGAIHQNRITIHQRHAADHQVTRDYSPNTRCYSPPTRHITIH